MIAGLAEESATRKSETAYEQLKAIVINGRVRPGRHLAAHDIAERLGISVTPVREALARLQWEGFLDRSGSHGFYSKEFRIDEQHQLLTMCELLLCQAMRTVDGRLPGRLITELSSLRTDHDASPIDGAALAARIEGLHLEITRTAGNDVLHASSRSMVERSHMARVIDLGMIGPVEHTCAQLRSMGVALSEGDPERAIRAAKEVFAARVDRLPFLVREANFIAFEATFP